MKKIISFIEEILGPKTVIPIISALAIFLLINTIYFKDGLSADKVLSQGDVMNFKGAAKEIQTYRAETGKEALWTNSMFGGMPAYQISTHYANRTLNFINQTLQLWLPQPLGMVFLYMLGFFILLLCLEINAWLAIIFSVAFAFSSYFFIIIEAGHNTKAVAIAYSAPLLGGIILLLRQKWIPGFILTTLFTGLEIYANHPQITYYMFLLAGLIILVRTFELVKEKKYIDWIKSAAMILAALCIGIAPNISSLWTTAEYGKFTTRGPSELSINSDGKVNTDRQGLPIDYATDWSYGTDESFTLLIPNFKGGASGYIADNISEKSSSELNPQYAETILQNNIYFGDQPFTSGPVYAGAIIVFLSILGLIIVRNPLKWALFGGIIFSLILSWGKNFPGPTQWFFEHFPYYNKFRAVSMILVVAELCLPLLAALALQEIIQHKNTEKQSEKWWKERFSKGSLIAGGIVTFFLLLSLISPRSVNTFHSQKESISAYEKTVVDELLSRAKNEKPGTPVNQLLVEAKTNAKQYVDGYREYLPELEAARIDYFKSDVKRSLLFVLIAVLIILLFTTKKIPANALFASLGLVILIDMWQVNLRYLNKDSFKEKNEEGEFVKTPADNYILNDKSNPDFRVISSAVNTFNNSTVSYFHKSIGGYHGAKLKRFQELREFYLDRELSIATQIADAGVNDSTAKIYLDRSCPILNMLNTRYIITQKNQGSVPFKNPSANSNAWTVSQIQWAPSADSEIVWTGKINTKTTAVINEQKFKSQLNGWDKISGSPASIQLKNYSPNYLKYEFESAQQQLVVFSEIWYPAGWKATIDGNPAPHVCANYVLRAMMVPAGKHTIEFKFEPESYLTGEKIALAGVGIFYAGIVGGLALIYVRRKKKNA